MRIPDEVRDCVCFIYVSGAEGKPRPIGTGFFVGIPTGIAGDTRGFVYIVTARHVIDGAAGAGRDRVFLRLNEVGGGSRYVSAPVANWKFRSDKVDADDVAILSWAPDQATFDYTMIDREIMASEELLAAHDVGVGDDVFLPGLFVSHDGAERILPIVRMGSIAAVPTEHVKTGIGPLHSYLVEARSIGGLSGSPVFVNVGLVRIPKETFLLSSRTEGEEGGPKFLLLGLMHGHFDVKNIKHEGGPHVLTEEKINMGIAIVVPVSRILEVIDHPDFVAERTVAVENG